jgi:hypothetical protein
MGKLMTNLDRIFWLSLFAFFAIFSLQVYAQTVDDLGFFQQVLKYIQDFGGLTWAGKVAGGIFILTGAMKVSFLDKVWNFLGAYRPLVPLVLSLIAGIVNLAIDPGTEITWAGVMAYVTAGAGSMIIASLLEMVKAMPGLGATTIKIIEFLQIIFRASGPAEGKKIAAKQAMRANMAA